MATYEFCVNMFGSVSVTPCASRLVAEACLREFVKGAGNLDLQLYDGTVATAFPKGGDPVFDAVAVVRPRLVQ